MSQPVLFEELDTTGGQRIGVATLNSPATLNGLSLEMVDLLAEQLEAWAVDPQLVMVVLRGTGDRAFCAGGDLHTLYRGMQEYREAEHSDPRQNTYAMAFFEREYRLDYRIHCYPKPLLCWGHGIVMGGGIGLMAGASHRVVTESSRLAMPETGIGLFPDVGGSWLLSHAPGASGRFLALTGASIDASDALYAGFADHAIAAERHDELIKALISTAWSGEPGADAAVLDGVLEEFALSGLVTGPLQRLKVQVDTSCSGNLLEAAVARIAATSVDESWWQKAQAALARACPSSVRLAWELQQRASRLSLAEVFQLELIAAVRCAEHGDFFEGIRALLIDKDRSPHWSPATLADADIVFIEKFFTPPWPDGEHPLADLGMDDPQRLPLG